MIAGLGQRTDLPPPSVPEFRKAVQQENRAAVCRPAFDQVQPDLARIELPLANIPVKIIHRLILALFQSCPAGSD